MKKTYSGLKSIASIPSVWRYYILLMLAALVLFTPLAFSNSKLNDFTDFDEHLQWAEDMKLGKPVPADVTAHSGWQLLVIFVNSMTGISFQSASAMATLFCWLGTLTVLYWWFLPVFVRNHMQLSVGVFLLLGVSVAAPISLLWFLDGLMYLGYIGITSYHNPTILLLKPFALLQFIFAYRLFMEKRFSNWEIVIAGLVSLLATFAKPSLAICLLPALTIIVMCRLLAKKPVDLKAFLLGIIVPTLLIVGWQFIVTYTKNDSEPIRFMPFAVMDLYSKWLLPKFILSIVFPLLVIIVYRKQAMIDARMILGWLTFIFGLFLTYFLAEDGPRFFDGNFTWSGEISLFLLFATSTLFYLDQPKDSRLLNWIIRLAWMGQVVSGIIYYLYCIYNKVYY